LALWSGGQMITWVAQTYAISNSAQRAVVGVAMGHPCRPLGCRG